MGIGASFGFSSGEKKEQERIMISNEDQSPVLVKIPYFEDLSLSEIKLLKNFFVISRHLPGPIEDSFNPKEPRFYIIIRGAVEIRVAVSRFEVKDSIQEDIRLIRTLRQGEWFGDMALLKDSRSDNNEYISVNIIESSTLLSISSQKFNEFLEVAPTLRAEVHASRRIGGVLPPPVQLKALPFFADVDEFKLNQLAALLTIVRVNAGTVLFKQGDISEGFYILVKGSISVSWRGQKNDSFGESKENKQGKEVLLEVLNAGSWFGEISLIQDSLRTATAIALQNSLLLFLEKSIFHKFVKYAPEVQGDAFQHVVRQRTSNMLKTLPFFSPLIIKRVGPLYRYDEDKLQILSQLFYYKTFEPDQVIFSEGEKGTAFYVLISGCCERIVQRPQGGGRVSLGKLVPGNFFGEISLLGDTLRTFTVISTAKTTCLKLDHSRFQKFFEIAPELKEPIESAIQTRTLEALKNIPLFRDEIVENKPWSKLELLATMFDYEQAAYGDTILKEGSEGEKFYLIIVGSVEVHIKIEDSPQVQYEKQIDFLRAGDYFGEVALLQKDGKRSASVIAKEPCMFLTLTKENFTRFLSLVPEAHIYLEKISLARTRKVERQKSFKAEDQNVQNASQ
jgi:CRP-like cAMP-binding protein